MSSAIDPRRFGLPPRTVLEHIAPNVWAIVIKRKSRIIMADGRKILEKAAKIRKVQPGFRVVLKTAAPVCSKTVKFLEGEGVEVIGSD